MAETYNILFRQIALKGNLMTISNATALESAYNDPLIGQQHLVERGTQFSETSIQDAMLNAMDRMISLISLDRNSPYRRYFNVVTQNHISGDVLPGDVGGVPTIGVVGTVRDHSDNLRCKRKDYDDVIGIQNMPTLKQSVYWFNTDNIRLWHTRPWVIIDMVGWSHTDQRALMIQEPTRGDCPFPETLHEAIVNGTLALLFRGQFNHDQAPVWRAYFNETLQVLGANLSADEIQKQIIYE